MHSILLVASGLEPYYAWLLFAASSACAFATSEPAAAQGSWEACEESTSLVQVRSPARPKPLLDVWGCPAEPGYVEAFHRVCGSSRLVRRMGCGLAVRRMREGVPMKEVYFLRHSTPICCTDCGLSRHGVEECQGLKAHNTLLKEGPLSGDSRAQVVFTSPATRSVETAVRIFGGTGAALVIDHLLVETMGYNERSWCRGCMQQMLEETNHTDVLEQYMDLQQNPQKSWRRSDMDPSVRIHRFTRELLARPEERIVVVTHHLLMELWGLGMGCMEMGETVYKAGLTDDGWFSLSEKSCGGRRRRWRYGNFRREPNATD